LTDKGAAHYRKLSARLLAMASTMAGDLSEAEIRKATTTVRQLSTDVSERL
jgi:hypothetical protein